MHSLGGLFSVSRRGLKAEILIMQNVSSPWLLWKLRGFLSLTPHDDFFPVEVALFKAGAAGRSNGLELAETSVRLFLF